MDEAQGNFKLNVLLEELMMAGESKGTLMLYLCLSVCCMCGQLL